MDDSTFLATTSAAPAAPTVPTSGGSDAARKAGEDFEAFFLSQSFENMFAGLDTDPLFGGGNAEGVYRSMLMQEYSKVAAKSGTLGIGDAVTREILKLQEAQGEK
jgi:Rod binding domain-containing protein